MNWINAFFASGYSIAYALGGLVALSFAWWVATCDLAIYTSFTRLLGRYAAKTWVAVILVFLSAFLLYCAYQVTAFERYFLIGKMPVSAASAAESGHFPLKPADRTTTPPPLPRDRTRHAPRRQS
jgi:hypothetical protein